MRELLSQASSLTLIRINNFERLRKSAIEITGESNRRYSYSVRTTETTKIVDVTTDDKGRGILELDEGF